jgi:DNA-directed RNA polymerase specialized sigma subunit
VQRRLETFARDYARRDAALQREREKLRRERDEALRAAYRDGLPLQDVAAIMGLSHQYVSRIVRR